MILEAFSETLRTYNGQTCSPERVLFDWLTDHLTLPPAPNDMIGRVLHTEIEMIDCNGFPAFEGRSHTGRILLESLYKYCRSYDHWQFTRWLHERQASDFEVPS